MLLRGWIALLLVFVMSWETVRAEWCPFCSAINLTFTEQIKQNDVVLVAKMTEAPKYVEESDLELPKAEFEVLRVIKGENFVTVGMKFKTLLVGNYELGQEFLIMGVDPPFIVWSTPLKSNPRILEYIDKLSTLPASGGDRLVYFQDYFEDADATLAYDAYDEFAVASYADLFEMKDRMKHDKLIEWIQNPDVPINRRRLYFTMLGVCGTSADIPFLEGLITSEDRRQQAGLDALIACYLCLKGPDGVTLIEKQFLANEKVDYVDTLAAISALRFHGTESNIIPKDRLVAAMRKMLDRPKLADMVIPDLARWEDWSVMDRLVELFKTADEQNNWLRVPIIQYLQACPKPEAKTAIEELRKIDPEAVKRATFYTDFGFGDLDDSGGKTEQKTEEKGGGSGGKETGGKETGGGSPSSTLLSVDADPANSTSEVATVTNQQVTTKKVPLITDIKVTAGTISPVAAPFGFDDQSGRIDPIGLSASAEPSAERVGGGAQIPNSELIEPSLTAGVGQSSVPEPDETQDELGVPNPDLVQPANAVAGPVVSGEGLLGNSPSRSPVATENRDESKSLNRIQSDSMADSTFTRMPNTTAPGNPNIPANANRAAPNTRNVPPTNPDSSLDSPGPVAQTGSFGWWVVLIPSACGTFLFVLLWSVIHGWFERLVF